ncbi:MAG: hypothetical protein OES38_00420 [Gammaproteobacteria bacterium]|nr:hypothetical protein [Gammaproteobacteria bacterium]
MTVSLHELQTKALETAQRFIDYDSYQSSAATAVRALHRRCEGWTKEQCKEWFDKSVVAHKHGIAFIQAHSEDAWEAHNQDRNAIDFTPFAGDYMAAHPAFPEDLLLDVLVWAFHWYHLR